MKTVECKLMKVKVVDVFGKNANIEVTIIRVDGTEVVHREILCIGDTLNLMFGNPNGKYHFEHPRKFQLSPQAVVEGSK